MPNNLTDSLNSYFGFSSFRPGQENAVRSLLAGNHTLVVMPTGAGKSLIFQLAALQLKGLTLVISPLIALMKDQVDSLTRHNVPATFINSTLPAPEQNLRLNKITKGEFRLVYIAPERLRNVQLLRALKMQAISLLVVDEAHCISEWGHDFRPDYLHIAQARAILGNPLTAALTATATPKVQNDIIRLLGLSDATRIITGFNRPNLFLDVRYASGLPSKLRLLKELLLGQQNCATIIYAGTRRDAEEVTEFAREVVRIPAEFYHAGLLAEERTRIQNDFISGRLNFIAATNAFGMGIDRADVRRVIHYSLPGSLEAYYQEAGRAGRDGQPARATLIYDPHDRALHEFFIANSIIAVNDLRTIHNAIPRDKNVWTTIDDLSRATSLHPVQIKVGLSELERAGALDYLGDDGYRMLLSKGEWNQKEIDKATVNNREHVKHRQAQLAGIVNYAESNMCRRKIILDHFGDTGAADTINCCDNCQSAEVGSKTGMSIEPIDYGARTPLIILDCIHQVQIKVGREKLAQILHGSKAQDILKFHHDKNKTYGGLKRFKQNDIEEMIRQLIEMGYIKMIGSKYPILSLTPRGENAIKQNETIKLKLPKASDATKISRYKAKPEAGGTVEHTAKLLSDGLKPEQIAQVRGLAIGTIYGHCAQLIENGALELSHVVSSKTQAQIEDAIKKVGTVNSITPIKMILPDAINYGMIRCVIVARQQRKRDSSLITQKQDENPLLHPNDIDSFLTKSHPRPLVGPWQTGWSLGFHSRISGGDWSRSGVGDLTYRLKYNGDISVLPVLVQQTLDLFHAHIEMDQVDLMIPVPSSTERKVNPVLVFCEALAGRINVPLQALVTKIRQNQPQKEMKTLAQKRANVASVFSLKGEIIGKRILLVDDLYDSGATLDEITRLLLNHGASRVNVLALSRTIHSDA